MQQMIVKMAVATAVAALWLGGWAGTATGIYINDVSVGDNTKGDGWELDGHRIRLKGSDRTYTVFGTDRTQSLSLHVQTAKCKVIARNLVLCPTNGTSLAGMKLDDSMDIDCELELVGVNRFTGGTDQAGLGVPKNTVLTISAPNDVTAELHCQSGGWGAGIGGGYDYINAGTITIRGGTIYARGGDFGPLNPGDDMWGGGGGAGIGGASHLKVTGQWNLEGLEGGSSKQVLITGGTVYAYGSNGAAGIGGAGGQNSVSFGNAGGNGGVFLMSGGRVFAYGGKHKTGYSGAGAGIGSGAGGRKSDLIYVAGGTLYAEAGSTELGCMDVGVGAAGVPTECGNFVVTGGSISTKYGLTLNPIDSASSPLYRVWVDGLMPGRKYKVDLGTTPYGTADIYAGQDGCLCLLLPNGGYELTVNHLPRIAYVNNMEVYSILVADYAIVFNSNGGSGTMKDLCCNLGQVYTLPKCTFQAPSGKSFGGWSCTTTAKLYDDGMIVFNLAGKGGFVTFTAMWK